MQIIVGVFSCNQFKVFNSENFLNDSRKENAIINYLTDLQNFKIGKKLENAQHEKEICELLNKLNAKSLSEVPSAIDQLIDLNDKLRKALDNMKSNQKKMAKAVKLLKAANNEITVEKQKAEEIVDKLKGKDLNEVMNKGKSKLSVVSNSQTTQNDEQQKQSNEEKENMNNEEEESLEIGCGFDDLFN